MSHRKLVAGKGLALMLLLAVIIVPAARAVDCDELLAAAGQEPGLLEQSQMLGEAVETCPKHAELTYKYGYSQERLRKYGEALDYYKRATKINAKVAKYYFGMADIYVIQKDTSAAIAAYEEGLRLEPQNSRARLALDELAPGKAAAEAASAKQAEAAAANKAAEAEKQKAEQAEKVATKAKEKEKEEAKITGPTLKVKAPNPAEFTGLTAVLEKDRAQQGKDDLAAAPGGAAFKTELTAKQEALRASAQADAVTIDSEKLKVGTPDK